jgi:hypothetical protein
MPEDNSYRKGQIDAQLANMEVLLRDIKDQLEKKDDWRIEVTASLASSLVRFDNIDANIEYLKKRDYIIGGIAGGLTIVAGIIAKLAFP